MHKQFRKQEDCITYEENGYDEGVTGIVSERSTAQGSVQEQILAKVIAMDQKIDEILMLLRVEKSIDNCPEYLAAPNDSDTIEMSHKMIENRADLIAFEAKLKNNSYKIQMQEIINSKFKSMEKYLKNYRRFGYAIIDTFCSRELFNEFSWSGKRSRDGQENYSFQDRIVFTNFLFEIIVSKIPTFPFSDLEDILSILCRNKHSILSGQKNTDSKKCRSS